MIFIRYNDKFEIELIHNMPFDEINGLGKTREELLKEGALVSEIPNIEVPSDKLAIYKYNPENNTVYCELIDRPLTLEELNAKNIAGLTLENKAQDDLINISMCATDEIFTMIEPLLAQATNITKGGSKMIDLYVAMVMRELKTIDEVPARYREEVKRILAQLEK
ncbi:hypothetical protein H9L25_00265 [Terrisporobacter mayombei]|nr:hypothetical protein [Terrisporobacter mayombei]